MLKLFQDMKPRWRNWWVRIFFTLVMIATFAAVIYSGPFAFMGLVRMFFLYSLNILNSACWQNGQYKMQPNF